MTRSPRRVKNGLLRGDDPEILEPSPSRVIPSCEYFARCGGCHYQHATYETQLAGEVDNFDAANFVDQRLIVQTDRWTWMALAATRMALRPAILRP